MGSLSDEVLSELQRESSVLSDPSRSSGESNQMSIMTFRSHIL